MKLLFVICKILSLLSKTKQKNINLDEFEQRILNKFRIEGRT